MLKKTLMILLLVSLCMILLLVSLCTISFFIHKESMQTIDEITIEENKNYIDVNDLTVYKSPYKKERIGKDYDGGYIICDIPNIFYDIFLSGGISNDISFEEALLKKYNYLKCMAFDGTIDNVNTVSTNIKFIKKNIGCAEDDNTTNLFKYMDENKNIFLKMDIEGGELEWFKCLSEEQLSCFSQMIVEFHYPFNEEWKDIFKKINKTHVLVHFHGNCAGKIVKFKNTVIPSIFECTYVNKKYVNEMTLNTEPLPSSIDMKNLENCQEIDLNYPPFVNVMN